MDSRSFEGYRIREAEPPPLKFGFTKKHILSDTFLEQFNTYPLYIETQATFYNEAVQALDRAATPGQWLEILKHQKDAKLGMLLRMTDGIGYEIVGVPSCLGDDVGSKKWIAAVRFARNGTYMALVEFLNRLFHEQTKVERRSLAAQVGLANGNLQGHGRHHMVSTSRHHISTLGTFNPLPKPPMARTPPRLRTAQKQRAAHGSREHCSPGRANG